MTTVIPPADLPSADISSRVDRLADALAEPHVPPSRRPAYVELQASSNFSFLRGASHADELALTAGVLGLQGLAVTDRNSMAGVVRAHVACRDAGLRYVVGCRLDLICDARPETSGERRRTRVTRTQARKPAGTEGRDRGAGRTPRRPPGPVVSGLPHRPRGLWSAVPAADPRATAGAQGRVLHRPR